MITGGSSYLDRPNLVNPDFVRGYRARLWSKRLRYRNSASTTRLCCWLRRHCGDRGGAVCDDEARGRRGAITIACSNAPAAARRRALALATPHAWSSTRPCARACPRSGRWAHPPRPPFPAYSRVRFCQLAKRFPEPAFCCLLFPLTRDPVSCDYP